MKLWVFSALVLLAAPVLAQDLRLPSNAVLTFEDIQADRGAQLPTAAWDGNSVPSKAVEGDFVLRSWRLDAAGLSSAQIMRSIREQLGNARFEILLDCVTANCGGFDFRFAIDVIRPPHMEVNLADYRFISAQRDDVGIMVLASRTRGAGFLQIGLVGATAGESVIETSEPVTQSMTAPIDELSIADQLTQFGRAVLVGLEFERGSAQLGPGPFASLEELATLLQARPTLEVALVGHTDSEGSLNGNIALSKRRAGSVLERLASELGVSRQQMEAEGMGYLSPLANNLTEDGREANRRVEVIITSTDN